MTPTNETIRAVLEPFSVYAGELFARNYVDSDVIASIEAEGGWLRITFGDFRRACTVYEALAVFPSAGAGEAVAVKPLEWEHHPHAPGHVRAHSPAGTYLIVHFEDYSLWGCRADGKELSAKADGIETAKAAAQADFDRRIRSAIVPAPSQPSERERRLEAALAQIDKLSADKWSRHYARAALAAVPSQPTVVEALAWTDDAEKWGDALNEAAWTFTDACPEKSALLFNNTKPALRAAILKYAAKVAARFALAQHGTQGGEGR